MSKCKYKRKSLSPLARVVTIRKHPWKGWALYRDGKDNITDQPFREKEEAEDFAREYCAYWGDYFGGFEE